jgi:hypothetical protein
MKNIKPLIIIGALLSALVILSASCTQPVKVKQDGDVTSLTNELVSLDFNLATGTYNIRNMKGNTVPIRDAVLKINKWSSADQNNRISWEKQPVTDESGKGMALILKIDSNNQPLMIFRFTLYENQGYFTVSGGIENTTAESIQVMEIHALAGGKAYPETDFPENFAMIDGFSAGEPLEYGDRMYSPLSREYAIKSRNNILLTFGKGLSRQTLVMGGLTYTDYEKFASLEQSRQVELEKGSDDKSSLLCYLNLPDDKLDESASGEKMELVKGSQKQTWQNHEFRCSETATSAMDQEKIILDIKNLDTDKPYFLGFSWWRGLRHGDRKDHRQSVFVEFIKEGKLTRIALLENQLLPRFDGVKKEDVEQVELPVPIEAVGAGGFQLIVEHPSGDYENNAKDPNVYLNELWLRDGTCKPLLKDQLTQINECTRPRREFTASLYAADPVGKKVDPGTTYIPNDQFYIDVTRPDPFEALEQYGRLVSHAQQIDLSMYDFPSVCLWYAEVSGYGGGAAKNTTLGAVNEMSIIAKSGFLKYSRVAVRLVPDSYLPNNQQGWWDDKHWQMEETDLNASQNGRYVEPYETSEKWGKAVTNLGGIPLTYFQTGFRSEDYAKAFPGHMLFNKSYAWRGEPQDTSGDLFKTWNQAWTRPRIVWGYDYTDPDFLNHLKEVYKNLASGGIKGLMFDYPFSGWASGGGMEDSYSTTAAAYRNIFRMPYEGLGPQSYVHERNMERGSDVSIGYVASMRTENDTDMMDEITVTRCGLRWYKNRVLYNQDTDSKNIARLQGNRDQVRSVLTMAYVTTGRLLLANSFSQFSDETFYDLTRTFPYHTENKSARPIDAFISEYPMVYDFKVDEGWHQVTFYNGDFENEKSIGINLSGEAVEGALRLDPAKTYHVYDFWNDHYVGICKGSERLDQKLRPGEARMLSVREVTPHPRVISANRHVMQGYVDMEDEKWDKRKKILSGTSKVVGGDPYIITIAPGSFLPEKVSTSNPDATISLTKGDNGLIKIKIESAINTTINWKLEHN